MNTDDIIDALNEVDDTAVQKARDPKKKSRKALWISVGAVAAACLALFFLTPNALNPFYKPSGPNILLPTLPPVAEPTTSERDYKPFGITSREEMISWGWDRLTTAERFSCINYNNADYHLKKNVFEEEMTVSPSFIGEKLTDVTAQGTDWRTETDYAMNCSLYEIAGVDPTRYLAVQYTGEENAENYYVFARLDAPLPATLGDFIAALNLTENLPFTKYTYYTYTNKKEKRIEKKYGLSPEDSKVVWDMISQYASVRTETEPKERSSKERITVYASPEDASSAASGYSRKHISLLDNGYLTANIEKYNYYFYLGEEAVAEIRKYLFSHTIQASEDSIKTLYGVVTEIGEDYIKIDDTLLMIKPEEGMEYTVYTHNLHVKRYILSERIKVGSHVKILHRDLSSDNPTEVQSAFYLEKGGFVFEENEAVEDSPTEPTATPYARYPKSHVSE